MKWTSELPTEPGFYAWLPSKKSVPIFINIVKVYYPDGEPVLLVDRGITVTTEMRTPADIKGYWIGPIEGPEDEMD